MKLNDTHLLLLSRASQHKDHLLSPPEVMKAKALEPALARLLRQGLMEEVAVRPDQPSCKLDEEGQRRGYRITSAGLQVLGLDGEGAVASCDPVTAPSEPGRPSTSKRSLVLELLLRDEGATLKDLIDATGWLPHTTRAVLSGLRKAGHDLTRERDASGVSVYRVVRSEQPETIAADGEVR